MTLIWLLTHSILPLSALYALEMWLRRRASRRITTSEWLAGMRRLDTVKPMRSRIEGKDGVCRPERKTRRKVQPISIRKAGR